MNKLIIPIIVTLGLAACAAPTLEERLAGKTGSERMKELFYACIERSDYAIPGGHKNDYRGHERRQWRLCDRMYETSKNGLGPETVRHGLAKECAAEINAGLLPDNADNVRHFQKSKKICEEMTGLPVVIGKGE